ncbi:MAG: porin family protein [Deltaproteobacteria bacterium]|nr:porin family protein [Deltaproteobacteria bacterium]
MESRENFYFDSNNPQDVELEYDSGIVLGAAAGYDFGSARIEGELAYQQNDIDKIKSVNQENEVSGDVSSFALLINGYYDFYNSTKFTPFVTAGIGFTKIGLEDKSDNDKDEYTVFAYQIGAGIGYALTEKVTIESKYRYFATSDYEFEHSGELEYNRHNLLFGVRVDF